VVANRRRFSVPVLLVAMAGGVQLAATPIKDSVVGVGEVPLGFEHVEDRWELRGQSSFSVPGEKLALMLPDGAKLTPVEPCEEVSVSNLCEAFSHRVVIVEGKAELIVETDEIYRIRTGHKVGVGGGLDLIGRHLPWDTKPALTFTGLPQASFSGETEGGELFIAGKRPGEGLLQENFGAQYVSVRSRRGGTLLRRKVGILPADFNLELLTGDAPGQGSIFVQTHQRCLFQLVDDNVDMQPIKKQDCTELRMSSKGVPPISVRLVVTPYLLSDPIEITLPFPNSGCLAFNANGQQLSSDLCVDDLLGARIFLFGRIGAPARYDLALTLRGGKVSRKVAFSWAYVAAETPLEVSLFSLKDQIINLLSLESGIDQVVELRVSGNGHDLQFRIRRYALEMQLDRYLQLIRATGTMLTPQPILMLLHDPMRTPVDLTAQTSEGVATGGFSLPTLIDRDGPWLVLPKLGSSVSFRPLYLSGKMNLVTPGEEIGSLQKAVLHFDPASPVSSFTTVLDAMVSNPMHSGWNFLGSLYKNYGYLPLATFEVWKALAKHDRALPMALLKFEMNPQLLARIEAEFPIVWEFQHLLEFRSVANGYAEFMKANGVAIEAVGRILSRMLSRLGEVFPAYGENIQQFILGSPVGPEMKLPVSAFQNIVYAWYQELIRDRSEAQWPSFGGRDLEAWYRGQGESVIAFQPEMGYRNSVVYLPVFAAAIASGKARLEDVFEDRVEAVFYLRQVRDFDSKWFNSIFQYCLLNRVMDVQKAELFDE
ncbi:MAG: STY4851/ECs_5259 family protein, partial [Spirochaetales bacterium]|nr:STY4851/ECs_5259 family protein [Spirochaetales bacterium]